jgi:hypothetical protein
MPSPPTGAPTGVLQPSGPVPNKPAFPFHSGSRNVSTAALVAQLPPENDARTLIDAYCRHFAWQYVWSLSRPTSPAGHPYAMTSDASSVSILSLGTRSSRCPTVCTRAPAKRLVFPAKTSLRTVWPCCTSYSPWVPITIWSFRRTTLRSKSISSCPGPALQRATFWPTTRSRRCKHW